MSDRPMRKTQARVAERAGRRAQAHGRRDWSIALLGIAVIAFALAGYLIYTGIGQSHGGANASTVGPRLQVDRDRIDLGDRKFNQPVRATFNVKNAGDDTLTLSVPKQVTVLEGC